MLQEGETVSQFSVCLFVSTQVQDLMVLRSSPTLCSVPSLESASDSLSLHLIPILLQPPPPTK